MGPKILEPLSSRGNKDHRVISHEFRVVQLFQTSSNHNTTQGTRPMVKLDHGQTRHRHAVFTLWVNIPTSPVPSLWTYLPSQGHCHMWHHAVESHDRFCWVVKGLKTCMFCFSRNQRFVKLMKILVMNFEVDKIYRLDMVSLCWLWEWQDDRYPLHKIFETFFFLRIFEGMSSLCLNCIAKWLKPCSRHLIRHAVFLRRFWLSVRWAIPMHNIPFCQEKRKQAT